MTSPPHRHHGFSLFELMCSMVIGSILLLAAAAVLGSYGAGYERVGGGVATEREARAMITRLTADLATGRFHKDTLLDPSSGSGPADRLGFLCLQPAQAQSEAGRIGDLCAVNYYLKDLSICGKTVRCLMRGCRDSKDTFNALDDNRVASLFTECGLSDEPVAFGVVSFEARAKTRDLSGHWIRWAGNDLTGPAAFDVRLVLARRELAGKLRRPADWDRAEAAAVLLDMPSGAVRAADLDVYATQIRFGSHENP